MSDATPPSAPELQIVRDLNYEDRYANNVRLEASIWDLKLLFGTLDQGTPDPATITPSVRFHTSVAVPWIQAKLMLYHLYVNVLFYERRNGPIRVPEIVRPTPLREFWEGAEEELGGEPAIERAERLWKELFGS